MKKRILRFIKRFNLTVSTLKNCVWVVSGALLIYPSLLSGSQLPPQVDRYLSPIVVMVKSLHKA